MFKFLQDETTIIGLKSLGLSKTKKQEIKNKTLNTIKEKKEQQKTNILISGQQNKFENTIHINFPNSQKTVEGLFGREIKLNLHK